MDEQIKNEVAVQPEIVKAPAEDHPIASMSIEERLKFHRTIRKSYKDILKSALISCYARKGKHLITHAVERAYDDDGVLIAMMKKIVPDKQVEEITKNLNLNIKVSHIDVEERLNCLSKE